MIDIGSTVRKKSFQKQGIVLDKKVSTYPFGKDLVLFKVDFGNSCSWINSIYLAEVKK